MRVVLTSEEQQSIEAIRNIFQALALECSASDCVSFANLPYRLAQTPRPALVLVHSGDYAESNERAIRQAVEAGLPVLAFGDVQDPVSQMQLVRTGARRYLSRVRLKEELTEAVELLLHEGAVKSKRGRLYAVTAVHPGQGISTVATNLAFAFANQQPGEAILVETCSGIPDLALRLDLTVRHPLDHLFQNWERCDLTMIRQALIPHPAGLNILAHSSSTLDSVELRVEVLRQLLILIRAVANHVVLELDDVNNPATREVFKMADGLVVVVGLSVPSLRLTSRYLRLLEDEGVPGDRILLVVNRYGQSGQADWRMAQEMLKRPFVEFIPDDPATVNKAVNQGKALVEVARRARITRSMDKLVQHLQKMPVR